MAATFYHQAREPQGDLATRLGDLRGARPHATRGLEALLGAGAAGGSWKVPYSYEYKYADPTRTGIGLVSVRIRSLQIVGRGAGPSGSIRQVARQMIVRLQGRRPGRTTVATRSDKERTEKAAESTARKATNLALP